MEEYVKNMRRDGVWADNLELQAMSEIQQARIEIFTTKMIPIIIFD